METIINSSKPGPKDAETMANILKEMGVTEYDPKVIDLMLEFSYRA
jgi:transcription initiation factor TFIID subunit 9